MVGCSVKNSRYKTLLHEMTEVGYSLVASRKGCVSMQTVLKPDKNTNLHLVLGVGKILLTVAGKSFLPPEALCQHGYRVRPHMWEQTLVMTISCCLAIHVAYRRSQELLSSRDNITTSLLCASSQRKESLVR